MITPRSIIYVEEKNNTIDGSSGKLDEIVNTVILIPTMNAKLSV